MDIRLLLLLLFSVCSTGAVALGTDREKPVEIQADSASLDDQRRTAVYEGNVVIVQGSLRITGDTVTMQFDEEYDLTSLVVEGRPAGFRQELDGGPTQEGRAERIEYNLEDGAMLFVGQAYVAQGEFKMDAERIHYDSATGSVRGAGSGADSGGKRVTIVLRGDKE